MSNTSHIENVADLSNFEIMREGNSIKIQGVELGPLTLENKL